MGFVDGTGGAAAAGATVAVAFFGLDREYCLGICNLGVSGWGRVTVRVSVRVTVSVRVSVS